jgi:hypothetical protein
MELTINKECLMRLLNLALTTEKRVNAKTSTKWDRINLFEKQLNKILSLGMKKTIKELGLSAEDFSGAVLNLQGAFRWFSKYNFKELKAVQNIILRKKDVDHYAGYDTELTIKFDTFGISTYCKSTEYQAKKEEEERLQRLNSMYGDLLRYKEELSNPTQQRYDKMNDFVAYDDILDFVTSKSVNFGNSFILWKYTWKQNNINKLVTANHNRWIENAEHGLKEYKSCMQRFFSDDLHKELIDDVFIAEIKGIEERLTKESEDSIKTVNECFNGLKNEVEAIFSSEASRLEFSMRLFYSFYSDWIHTNKRLMLNDFKNDVSNIKEMINSFDVNLLTNEQIFDIWNKMQELLKVKKNKADVYTNEQKLEKTKELMALNIEFQKYSKYGLGCNLFSLIEKSDVEIDKEIAGIHASIERKKQEKVAEEEFELKANVVTGVDSKTKEPKQFKVAVGMLADIYLQETGYINRSSYVIIDIDMAENKIQVMDRERNQFWLDCKTIHDIDKKYAHLHSCSLYRFQRDKILGDLLPYFIEQAESKGLYVIQ